MLLLLLLLPLVHLLLLLLLLLLLQQEFSSCRDTRAKTALPEAAYTAHRG